MIKILKRLYSKSISMLGGDNLSRDFMYTTLVHVLLMLATGLSSVFISVFLFKMNNSDYILTAKYNTYWFFFETITYLICLLFYKSLSLIRTMQLGLIFYSISYIFLLIFRNNIADYYIIVAFLTAMGSALYWSGYYLLISQHTTLYNRQQALGFNGVCCYIVSVIASPISGFITTSMEGMSGYIVIFSITIITFIIAALISTKISCTSNKGYKINFLSSFKYVITNKATLYTYSSEFVRGIHEGITYHYTTILLFSVTSNELVLSIALTIKNLSLILSSNYTKKIKSQKQRLLSAIIPIFFELLLVFFIIKTLDTSISVTLIFIYCSTYVIVNILQTNLSQIPLFESMILLKKHCKTDFEFMSIRQIFFSSGRMFGVMSLIFIPIDPIYALIVIFISIILSIFGSLLCHRGAKLISKEVNND